MLRRVPVPAFAATLLLLQAVPAPAAEPPRQIELEVRSDVVILETGSSHHSLRLTVQDPDGRVFERQVETAARLSVGLTDSEGQALPDGLYVYELEGRTEAGGPEVLLRSGFFSIQDGAFVSTDLVEEPQAAVGAGAGRSLPLPPDTGFELDQVVPDDLIVQGSVCTGFDCLNGEAFGFDTIRLKENNLRIKFEDTSASAGFPTQDWALVANDSAAGGADRFSIQNCFSAGCDSNSAPFTILGAAPANSLFVSNTGRVGFRTAIPVLDIHTVTGNTPGLRLEQDASSGFTPQTWDVAGNELNFFVRDSTAGVRLPLRIRPGSPSNSLTINPAGVGVGTFAPTELLEVAGNVAVAGTVDGRDVSADGSTLDAHLVDFDNPHQVTAAQVGADPAGTAAAVVAAHEAAFDSTTRRARPASWPQRASPGLRAQPRSPSPSRSPRAPSTSSC